MNKVRPSIVILGAGNIGRGFIGQLFSQADYDVIFIDAAEGLVKALNESGQYPIQLVSEKSNSNAMVGPVKAFLISDQQAVNEVITSANIIATAVGVPILPYLAEPMAQALQYRNESGNSSPLDVLVCENKLDAASYLKGLILSADPSLTEMLDQQIGFVETSIGRMVPALSAQERINSPLLIRTEPFNELPVDAAAFKGPLPAIESLKPFSPFHFYHQRKLFIHNMGHAMTAYLGWLIGCETISEAVSVPEIRSLVEQAMRQVGQALSEEYAVPFNEIDEHIQDLLYRFSNRQLGDTVLRVGRDPMRKLAENDRLVGAMIYTLKQGIDPFNIAIGIAAALQFSPEDDPTSGILAEMVNQQGLDQVLQSYCQISGSEQLLQWRHMILAQDALLKIMLRKNK